MGDQIWLHLNKAYRPLDKPKKHEISRRQELYPMVRKISLFVYKLNLLLGAKIHPVVSIAYLSRYRVYKDPFGHISPLLKPVKHGLDTDMETSGDNKKQGKHWELKCIVAYKTRCN